VSLCNVIFATGSCGKGRLELTSVLAKYASDSKPNELERPPSVNELNKLTLPEVVSLAVVEAVEAVVVAALVAALVVVQALLLETPRFVNQDLEATIAGPLKATAQLLDVRGLPTPTPLFKEAPPTLVVPESLLEPTQDQQCHPCKGWIVRSRSTFLLSPPGPCLSRLDIHD
jgi:hypothetical protein